MSFTQQKELIEDGDTVIVRRDTTLEPLVMKSGAQHQLTCGLYRHSELIGQPYGSKIYSHNKKGHATFLYPTPELWTLALPHRTQILYHADISLICIQLELAPGMKVVESGTGSGSLTHALARAVGPAGRVDTCEFHKERAETAGKEFESHGISHIVHSHHRDVVLNGFPVTDADAVFLDLPSPWDVIKHTVSTFGEGGGRLCSFSPCIEQVQKCCLALQEHGFEDIQTMEVIQRPYQLSRKKLWEPFIGKTRHKKFREEQRASDKKFESGWVHAFVKGGPKKQAVGHTGYLTFATLPYRERTEEG